jgi:hypothetical protein
MTQGLTTSAEASERTIGGMAFWTEKNRLGAFLTMPDAGRDSHLTPTI